MVFRLAVSKILFSDENERNKLETLGFEFYNDCVCKKTRPKIELETLEDLMSFVTEHGDAIVHKNGEIRLYGLYV